MWINLTSDVVPLTKEEESDLIVYMTDRYIKLIKDDDEQVKLLDLKSIIKWYDHLSYSGGDKLSDDHEKISEFVSYNRADFIVLIKETLECMVPE